MVYINRVSRAAGDPAGIPCLISGCGWYRMAKNAWQS